MSLLPQLSNYIGMLLVGFFIPVLLKRKMNYKLIQQGDDVRFYNTFLKIINLNPLIY